MMMTSNLKGEYIQRILKRNQMPRNQVAAISGLSNAYIKVLEKGETTRVSSAKLISFAIALNLNLNQTDKLLSTFNRPNLSDDEIPFFIEASKKIQMSSAMLPLRDIFIIELMFLAIERIPGRHVIMNNRPTSCLRPAGHRTYSCRNMPNPHPLHSNLIEAIGRERKLNMLANLIYHPVEEYIFIENIEKYLLNIDSQKEKAWRIKHIENVILHLKKFENFKLFLTEKQTSFLYTLKMPADPKNKDFKLTFMGKQIDFSINSGSGGLAGFATGNQIFIENFKMEVDNLNKSVINEYLDPENIELYLKGLIHKTKQI